MLAKLQVGQDVEKKSREDGMTALENNIVAAINLATKSLKDELLAAINLATKSLKDELLAALSASSAGSTRAFRSTAVGLQQLGNGDS